MDDVQVGTIPFNQQNKNFENTHDQMTDNLAADKLAKCIFFVGVGSNDYLMPNYATKNRYNAQQYADLLVHQYSQQLSVRHMLGLISIY